ncbi:MAG TPA: TonB-dependent receptor [Vicinamibacterales bacterium]|nr:TonB-dependent receptor [Vicinamibacterales bacterium]
MNTSRVVRLAIAVAVATIAYVPSAGAQVTEGRFTGTVVDPSGAAVPGAAVVVKSERTGEERTAMSNAQGRYLVTGLKPSVYTIKATLASFAPLQYTGLQLLAAQEFSLDLQLQPAGLSESVTVQGEPPSVDLSSARIGVNVGERDVQNLPVNGRQMSQLLLQAPGSLNSGTGTWQDVRFSGRAVEQNAIRYDGVEGSAIIDAAPGNLNGEIPTPFKLQASLENVQEFRIESNSYPAEFGTGTGGQVNVVTKSGTNRPRGSIFEYYRNDALDAPNFFDTAAGLAKSELSQHQFGGSIGGPILKDRAFFFGSYEGYQLKAGINFVEGVPSDAAWARAVPAIAALRPGFLAPNAVILPGASSNPDFDIAQLQGLQDVKENAFSGRVDFRMGSRWSAYGRVFHDQGKSLQPEGVTGRVVDIKDNPTNAVFNLQGIIGSSVQNELKVGYNAAPTNIVGVAPVVNGIDFGAFALNLSGTVANTGIAGQGSSSGIAVPGGLVRANSATNGHAQPYDPYTISLIDGMSTVRGGHYLKAGGELRAIRMSTDRIGGTTYTFANITAFLANQAGTVQYLGDVSAPSPFNNGATGERHVEQEYYVAYAQDEWHFRPNATLNYGLRYDYYTPLREADDLIVKFNIDTGVIDPNTTPLYRSKKNNVQPRVSMTYAPNHTVFRGGFGIFVGPGQTEDQIQPVESDRISSTLSNGSFPVDPAVLTANFVNNPNNRAYQPRAYANDYTIPERIYQYTASVQQDLGHRYTATAAYMGSQGRNLFLRSVANQIVDVVTNPNPTANAFVIREFSIVQRDAAGNVTGVQNPYAEVDYKTTGGEDTYQAMMLSLSRRAAAGVSLNVQYTLGRSRGNTAGSNEALTAGNNARALADFAYDNGYNNFDVRHTFNLSLLYPLPYGRGRAFGGDASGVKQVLLGGWDIGGIANARSGLPVDVRIVRPDIVYRDPAGNIFANPAADRVAIVNTPGGGASRNVRRPNLVPGVNPFITDGGTVFLNPAAFSTPAPGTFGDLERNSIHGPNFKQVDFFFAKHFSTGGTTDLEFRGEVFNLFDTVNFANPVGTLPQAIPTAALSEANRVQPGQPYTAAAAGTFGRLTSTVGRTVGLGTPRQIQFALRFSF